MGTIVAPSSFRDALAAQFNGADEYAYRDNPSFKGDTQGCFSLWLRPTTILSTTGFKPIIGYGVKSAGNDSMWHVSQRYNTNPDIAIPYRNAPILDFTVRTTHGGTTNRAYGNHIFSAATWVHYLFQSNGSTCTHYINGVSVGGTGWLGGTNTGDWLGDISGSDHRLALGCRYQANIADTFADARQNEVLYFNRPLTSGEIAWLYNGGVPVNPHRDPALWSACRLWLRCGDSRDNGTTLFDESGYGNDFTLVNMDASNYVAP